MFFAKNLKYLRKLKEWSQDYIAEKLGYKSFTTIQKWESGTSEPPMSTIRTLCIMFNMPMDLMLNVDLEKINKNLFNRIESLRNTQSYRKSSLTESLDIAP